MLPTCPVTYNNMSVHTGNVNIEMLNSIHNKQKLCLLQSGNVIWAHDL